MIGPDRPGEPAGTSPAADDPRTAEIAANLAALRGRIGAACSAAGRDPAEITLIAVTKTFPVADARRVLALGVVDLGENRDQAARVKAAEVPAARWHFVGRLQRNKARSVAGYAAAVHSVDSPALVAALAAAALARPASPLDVFVQVSLDGTAGRGGALPADVPALAAAAAAAPGLRLRGVMAVAPLGADPDVAFAALADVAEAVRTRHPGATAISAGMSQDMTAAIRHGATHLRIGTALLGGRAGPVR